MSAEVTASARESAAEPGAPTGARAARKRRDILGAARRVFLREGFGVGVDALAAEAQVSKATLYNHFGSKEKLFTAVIGQTLDEALSASEPLILTRLAESEDVRTDLTAACRAWVGGVAAPEVLALRDLLAAERHRFPALGSIWQERGPARTHAALGRALDRLAARGLLRLPDTELAVLQLSGLVLSPHLVYASHGTHMEDAFADRLIETGVDMFLAYYGTAATAR